MPPDSREREFDALMSLAESGGRAGASAAKRAAALALSFDSDRARRALAVAARLDPVDASPRLALARMHAEAGDLGPARAEAEGALRDSADPAARARAAFMIGEIARATGAGADARNAYAAVMQIEEQCLAANRTDPVAARWFARARGRVAELDAADGQIEGARIGAEGALALLRALGKQMSEAPELAADIADAELRLGALELDRGEAAPARRHCGEAIARYEALILHEPNEPHWRAVLADAWALAAEADLARHAPNDARAAMDKALALRVRLAHADPSERWALAATWRLRAALLAALNDAPAAADSLAQARALAERFCAETPGADAPTRFLVHTTLDQADHALRTQRLAEAQEAANAARARAEAFARAPNAPAAWFGDVGACWDRLGEIARAARADAQALDAFSRAVECRRMAHEAAPEDFPFRRALAAALLKQAAGALHAGEANSARRAAEESASLRMALAQAQPNAREPLRDLAVALEHVGHAALAQGDAATARTVWEDELALAERLFPDDHDSEGLRFVAIVSAHLANLGGVDAEDHRRAALGRFDILARDGALNARDAALRKKLWRP